MTFARILGGAGRVLITAGLVILGFVVYQLWGTGLQEQKAQNELEEEFAALLDAATTPAPPATSPSTSSGEPSPPTTAAESLIPEAGSVSAATAIAAPQIGDPMAVIEIPRLGVSKVVVEGVSVDDLKRGPGHYLETAMPGTAGNASIAGHRTTYGAPFNRIDELEAGDEISVSTLWGDFTYEVMPSGAATKHYTQRHPDAAPGNPDDPSWIVRPEDTWVLDDFADNRLTLTACHPKYSARQRIIVVARLVSSPAEPPPPAPPPDARAPAELPGEDLDDEPPPLPQEPTSSPADLDQGLGGDQSARAPAVLWGLGTLVVWLIGWLVARRNQAAAAVLTAASPVLGAAIYPDAISEMWIWALGATVLWAALFFASRRWVRWQPFLVVAPAGLLTLIPCFYYVDRFLPAG